MPAMIIATIDATVDPQREQELIDGFRRMNVGHKPEGVMRSELLGGQGGTWRLRTTWREREASVAVRNSGETPAAMALLDSIAATHHRSVFTVEQAYGA